MHARMSKPDKLALLRLLLLQGGREIGGQFSFTHPVDICTSRDLSLQRKI